MLHRQEVHFQRGRDIAGFTKLFPVKQTRHIRAGKKWANLLAGKQE
jgi:hypothetical protein